ncbi:MAG: LysR family transcriptional regulator [Sulfitobacter sp.]|nr:LysR family transcriptional regulator [Sulfitobacter sp.]
MNFASLDLNLLRVLDALLETRSTTYAGQRIGLSQPAVSSALGRLRRQLDDPLFIRNGPRLEPTDYALSLSAPLRDLLEKAEILLSGPPAFDPQTAEETFRISGSDFFAEILMPRLAGYLSENAPKLRVQLVDLVPDDYVATLETDSVDLALLPQLEGPSWMEWQPLFNSSFALVARRGNPRLVDQAKAGQIDIGTFCDLDHILFSPEGKFEAMVDAALSRKGHKRRVVMTLPVMYGVCSTVAETDYVALVPQQLAHKLSQKLSLDVIRPPFPIHTPPIGMAWHRRRTNAPAHRWLRDQLARLLVPLNEGEPPLAD